jgi:hypothetical protein
LAAINNGFKLGRHIKKENGGGQNDDFSLPDQWINFGFNVVIDRTVAFSFTDHIFLAGDDIFAGDLYDAGLGTQFFNRLHETCQ